MQCFGIEGGLGWLSHSLWVSGCAARGSSCWPFFPRAPGLPFVGYLGGLVLEFCHEGVPFLVGPPMLVFSCRLRPLVKFLQGFSEGFLLLPASFSSTFLLSFYGFYLSTLLQVSAVGLMDLGSDQLHRLQLLSGGVYLLTLGYFSLEFLSEFFGFSS